MRASTEQPRTFTEVGRRAQIVTAAIDVIAEVGHAKASFTRIARHAGLSSTGLISYHFAGKDDLLAACVAEIEQVAEAFMQPAIDAADGHAAVLRAYVETNVALVGEHPAAVRALIDMVTGAGARSGGVEGRLELFESHLREGVAAGAYRAVDTRTVALALIGGIDTVVAGAVATAPGPEELARQGAELAQFYLRALATDPDGSST